MPLVPDIGPQHGRPQLGISQADSSETHCSIYLGQLDELFQQMLHQAASICFLGPTEHHEEMTASHTEFSLEFLVKQRRSIQGHSGEVFWSTDWGRLLDAALRQGDPERFQPLGAWVIFYQEKGTTCKMCRYYSQQSAETRLRQIAKPAILLGPAPDYRRILNRKEFESQAEPLLEAIDAHLLAIGAKEPEVNQAATDGDLWDFLNDPPKIFDFLQTLPEESGSSGRARTRSECSSTPDSEMTRSMMEDNQDSSEGVLSQEVELVRAKWVARNWTRCGLSAALLGESAAGPTFGPDVMANVVLQMAEDFAALLEIRRTILVPLEGVCMQLGTLRSRRILHAALARLSLHVDQFVECAQQFHQIFEARLFESLRSVDSKPDPAAAARAPRPAVQRSYRRSIQRAFALRREIFKKVQQLGETVPLQSAEDEQCSFDKLKSSMAALAQALSSPGAGGGAYLTDARTLALADAPRASLKSKRQSMKANSVLVVD
ncbi:unnamed protein product [Durusdinium trenchii]|uniref:Uncharacterized protein n=2 Tax=Durusdinium trenchii TaxID=1381693 RepID=A0ABP0QAY1_9DINO